MLRTEHHRAAVENAVKQKPAKEHFDILSKSRFIGSCARKLREEAERLPARNRRDTILIFQVQFFELSFASLSSLFIYSASQQQEQMLIKSPLILSPDYSPCVSAFSIAFSTTLLE